MTRGVIQRELNKLNIAHELMANRYLLSVLVTQLSSIEDTLANLSANFSKKERKETKEQEKFSHTLSKEKEKKEKKERNTPKVEFTYFTLTGKQFESLTKSYGANVASDACVMMDYLIGTKHCTYKNTYRKVKEIAEQFKTRDNLYNRTHETARLIRSVDYHLIETKEEAMKYIYSTPSYYRNLDEGVKYLSEKFSIDVDLIRRS